MVSEELIASQNVWEPWGFYGRVVGALPGALSSFCDSLMRALPGFVWVLQELCHGFERAL